MKNSGFAKGQMARMGVGHGGKPENSLASRNSDGEGTVAAGGSNSSIKLKTGGAVHGDSAKKHLGRVARKSGGRVNGKGKTVVNINLGDKGQSGAPQPIPVPIPMPPQGGPPGMPPGLPPGMPGGGMPPHPQIAIPMGGLAGAGGPPPMMRKDGGRVTFPKENFGSRSGLGRLAKIKSEGSFMKSIKSQ